MRKKTACLICLFFLLVINGCASIKQYNSNEFNTLPLVEQNQLCQKWKNILPGTIVETYYSFENPPAGEEHKYDVQAARLRAAAANLGNAIGAAQQEANIKRAMHNFGYCTARHFSKDIPEGYSFYFGTKTKGIKFLKSDVDSLNIKATQAALDGRYLDSIKLTTQALNIQENPYSYKIQAATFILAAQNTKKLKTKNRLLNKSIESSNKVIDSYIPNGKDYFLNGYAYYLTNQHEKAYQSLNMDSRFIKSKGFLFYDAVFLYRSLILVIDSEFRNRIEKDKAIKDGYVKNGGDDVTYPPLLMAKVGYRTDQEWNISYPLRGSIRSSSKIDLWYKESNDDLVKIWEKGNTVLENKYRNSKLLMPDEILMFYLDHTEFRGYEEGVKLSSIK